MIPVVIIAGGIREVRSDHAGVVSRLLAFPVTILMPEDKLVYIRFEASETLAANRGGRGFARTG